MQSVHTPLEVDRRHWHLDKTLNVSHLLTTVVIAGSLFAYANNMDRRVAILEEKMQSDEYGWLDYLNHFSEEWQNEYQEYCKEHALCIGNESAEQFVKYKDELLEQGMETENA